MTENIATESPALSVAETAAQDQARARRNNVAIILLLISVFVVFLNETLIGVAIPNIMADLGITPSQGQWLTTAYALTMAVVIPITGFLLQRVNTRPVFITAMTLFTVGTLVAATSGTFFQLVIGRVVQAGGTAIMMPLLMTTVLTLVPMSDRGRIMGRISIVMSVAPAIGPAISGIILNFFTWPFLFWLVLPISLAALVVGIALVPNVGNPRKIRLDVLSVILSAFAFSGIVFGLSALGQTAEGKAMMPFWIPLGLGIIFLTLFIWRQLRLQHKDAAFLDLRVFKARTYTVSVTFLVILMMALFGVFIVLPIYLIDGLGFEAIAIGTLMLPGGLLMGLLGPFVGRLYDRFGPRPLVIPGSAVVSLALWGMASFGPDTNFWFVFATYTVMCLGLGFLFTPLFTSATGALPPHLYSHGSAIIATVQQVAGAAGTATFVAFLAIGTAAAGATDPEFATGDQVVAGAHLAFMVGAFISLAGVVAAFFVRKPDHPEVNEEELAADLATSSNWSGE